jgi:hypothetical protein
MRKLRKLTVSKSILTFTPGLPSTLASDGSIVVQHSPHIPKIKASSPAPGTIYHNSTQLNDTVFNDIQYNETDNNKKQHNDTNHKSTRYRETYCKSKVIFSWMSKLFRVPFFQHFLPISASGNIRTSQYLNYESCSTTVNTNTRMLGILVPNVLIHRKVIIDVRSLFGLMQRALFKSVHRSTDQD